MFLLVLENILPQIKICTVQVSLSLYNQRSCLSRTNLRYLTNRRVARMGYQSIAHVEKPNGLLTRGPLEGERANCFSIIHLVGQERQ